jgi:hypothetical protein
LRGRRRFIVQYFRSVTVGFCRRIDDNSSKPGTRRTKRRRGLCTIFIGLAKRKF